MRICRTTSFSLRSFYRQTWAISLDYLALKFFFVIGKDTLEVRVQQQEYRVSIGGFQVLYVTGSDSCQRWESLVPH